MLKGSYHVVAWQQLLQELGLLVLDSFDDELIIAGQVEQRAAGPWVGQLDQRLLTDGVLHGKGKEGYTITIIQSD